MKPKQRTTIGEVWMQVRDCKKLQRLMVIQEATQVQLAAAVGWRSHTIVGRLLNGTVTTVTPEKAVLIANFFQVPVDDLFATRVSSSSGHSVSRSNRVA